MNKLIWSILLISVVGCARRTNEVVIDVEKTEQVSDVDMEISPEEVVERAQKRAVYNETETVLTDLVHTKLEVKRSCW